MHRVQVDPKRANWIGAYIERNVLYDEIDILQYGQNQREDFLQMSFGFPEPSSKTIWPTKKDPSKLYKLASIWLEQGLSERIVERSTYSFLDWVGNVGGLFNGLRISFSLLLTPITAYSLRSVLLDQVYSSKDSKKVGIENEQSLAESKKSSCRCLRRKAILDRV